MDGSFFVLNDPSQIWFQAVLDEHLEEAQNAVDRMLEAADTDANGCRVTQTAGPRKLRFAGRQERVYRFVFVIVNHYAPSSAEVVRHRCNNRRCINPNHLELGDKLENYLDDRGFRANGVDFDLL